MSVCDHSKVCTEKCEHRKYHEIGKLQCAEKRYCHIIMAIVQCS